MDIAVLNPAAKKKSSRHENKILDIDSLLSQLRHSDPEQGEGEESCIVEILRRFAPQNDKCNSTSQNDFVVGIHRLIWT